MKNYRITVNGNTYDVQVEETNGVAVQAPVAVPVASPAPVVAAPAPAPVVAAAPAPAPVAATPAPSGAQGSFKVQAPMPGNILDIKVNVGDSVGVNQAVVILEAMKMENEIVTPVAGTVASINVTKGQAVNSEDILITIAE